ncbi:MAG TPA: alpha/beta fold hydrolase [Candidatus Xenobia bacterium]
MKTSTLDAVAWGRWLQLTSGEKKVDIGRSPKQVVYQRDRLTVYRYGRDTPARYQTPILLVYSLINRPAIMDLLPDRSLVQNLLTAGFDVYLLDWGVPDAIDRDSGLDVYLNLLLHTVVKQVCRISHQPSLTILGYCMGGSMSAMYTALHPERVRNLVMLGAPVCFKSEQLLYRWGCDRSHFKPEDIVAANGNAPAWAFDGFSLLRAEGKMHRWADLYDHLDDPAYVENHLAMDEWVYTNVPMAGAVYVEFITKCFQENQLMEGRMEIAGTPVKLDHIKCPVLVIAGSADHLVPPETACPLADLLPQADRIVFPAGHIGLTVGRSANTKLWPQACAWMAARSNT